MVEVIVTNDDGASGSGYTTVTVDNVAPTATFNTNSPVDEGSDIVVSLTSPSDPSTADTAAGFTYAFDLGSGYEDFGSSNTASITAADDGVVTVKGKIMDKDGGVTEYTADVTVNKVIYSYTYNLVSGWNLISVPLNVPDNTIEGFFPPEAREDLVAVWGWNDDGQSWMYYSPNPYQWYADNFPVITNMETGKAYWVQMDASASFTITGTIPSSAPASPQPFVSNWNFMGPTGDESSTPDTMYPDAIAVWGWNAGTQSWMYYSQNPYQWYADNFPAIESIDPGHGYWVQMPVLEV
jgi:hypothetical protein